MEGQGTTIHRDISRFLKVESTKLWTDLCDTFVLPQHCEQVYEYVFKKINSLFLYTFYIYIQFTYLVKNKISGHLSTKSN